MLILKSAVIELFARVNSEEPGLSYLCTTSSSLRSASISSGQFDSSCQLEFFGKKLIEKLQFITRVVLF